MNGQKPKMRFIAMFYLMVFSSALLLSGILNHQRSPLPLDEREAQSLVFSTSADSIPVSGLNASAEANENPPEVSEQDDRPDMSPFLFSFNFTSILQWVFGLTTQRISVNAEPALSVQHNIWLSVRSLRI